MVSKAITKICVLLVLVCLTHNVIAKDTTTRKNRVISAGLNLIDLKKHRNLPQDNTVYNEVLSYSESEPYGDAHGRSTNIHETVHGINNVLRNSFKKSLKKNVNGFYAGVGKGIIIDNPSITMRDIIPYIPEILRGYRYKLYFIDQLGDWNDVPTYPMDEWSAYIAGAECAIDDFKHNIPIPKSDYVSGALEFSIYCTALSMAIKNKDNNFWNNNEQFKNAMKYYLIKSEKIFAEGEELFPADQQTKLLFNLRNHDDAKDIRDFLNIEFDGIFVD